MRHRHVIPQLKKLAADPHIDLREASKILGISAQSVRRYCQRLGINWTRRYKVYKTLPRNIKIYRAWRSGARIVDLARQYNLSPSRIVHIIMWSQARIQTIPPEVLERWIQNGSGTSEK
jgi:DNA-binding CsgD family transcriptional regulator